MRNKLFFLVIVLLLAVPLVLTGVKRDKTPAVDEDVEEDTTGVSASGDEVDPWILKTRKGLEKYRGSIMKL